MPPEQAHAVVFAAVRELFEESGTLLAVHADGTPVTDSSPYHADRLALTSHRSSLTRMFPGHALRIRSDLWHPWTRRVGGDNGRHWYDASSLLAVVPAGQEPDGNISEADDTNWFRPRRLLEGRRHGIVRLAVPTRAQLRALAGCTGVDGALLTAAEAGLIPVAGDPTRDPRYGEYFAPVHPERT